MAYRTSRATAAWLRDQPEPRLDRIKLGGIHRTQPFSHHFERSSYRHYFLASWAHLQHEDQIAAYELLRDGRARKKDVSPSVRGVSSSGDGLEDGDADYSYCDNGWFEYDAVEADAGGDVSGADAGLGGVEVCPDGWDGSAFGYPGDGSGGQGGNVSGVGPGDSNDGGINDGGTNDGGTNDSGSGYYGGYIGGRFDGGGDGGGGCGGCGG